MQRSSQFASLQSQSANRTTALPGVFRKSRMIALPIMNLTFIFI